MNKKIGEITRRMLFVYTAILSLLFLATVVSVLSYNRINEIQNMTRGIVNIIADDLNSKFFTMQDGKVVIDDFYKKKSDFAIEVLSKFPEVNTIYIYTPINADQKIYLLNIEHNEEDKTPYNVESFINMGEEFDDEINPLERACYLTGKLDKDSTIQLFSLYGSVVSTVAPVYNSNHEIIAFVGLDYDITLFVYYILSVTAVLLILLIVLSYAVGRYGIRFVNKMLVRPIQSIEENAKRFASSEHNGNSAEYLLPVVEGSENELNVLSASMNKMMQDIDDYIVQNAKITAEKERIGAELDVATKIQANYLPNLFPPFPGRKEFDLYATMNPAKEVGGDFYDFFMVDDDHIALVVADVSGKGVPAALFMMIGKTIIKNWAANISSPAEILKRTNNHLCESNEEEMFITVWLGIVDTRTGNVKVCNAGHSAPCVYRAGEGFTQITDKHGFVTALMPDIDYPEYEIQLNPGDFIFNCTDGVMEATDAHEELFGEERMLAALNAAMEKNPQAEAKDILHEVRRAVDEFVGEAPQFDDITMIGFRYIGKNDNY